MPTLREGRAYAAIRRVFAAANESAERCGRARVVHYSVMSNHLHLLVESPSRDGLSRGVQGLATRLARAVNGLAGCSGKVFADRYHARILKTPREVRHALVYVLNNARRHGLVRGRTRETWIDPYSSGGAFDGWRSGSIGARFTIPVSRARTWLLTHGWRRHGLVDPSEVPRGLASSALASC
jgi:REP element-mobilizing transposase RayT